VLEADDGGEEAGGLLEAEDDGELLGLPGAPDALQDARSFEGDLVEELQRGDGLVVDAPGDVLLLDEVEEMGGRRRARGLRASVRNGGRRCRPGRRRP
jgi:hypothetical protein